MATTRKERGATGEKAAVAFLETRHGYRIVDTNVHLGSRRDGLPGELDVVAWDGDTLCFIEIKTRTDTVANRDESPAAAVTPAKQRQIVRLATAYALQCGLLDDTAEFGLRFDVVSVRYRVERGQEVCHCELIRAAFDASAETEDGFS